MRGFTYAAHVNWLCVTQAAQFRMDNLADTTNSWEVNKDLIAINDLLRMEHISCDTIPTFLPKECLDVLLPFLTYAT